MKRFLLVSLMVLALACMLAFAVSATTIYKDESGTELFRCEIADGHHIDSYEIVNGGFARYDGEGNALTWYLLGTATQGENVVKTVKAVKTTEVFENGSYTNGVTKKMVVSAAFEEGMETIPEYGAYSSNSHSKELLFVYVPNSVKTLPMRFCQNTPVVVCEFSESSLLESWGDLSFWGAKSLRSIFIPQNFTKFPNSKDGELAYCKRLEVLTFHENSTLETLPSWKFGDTRIKRLVVPDSVTYLNSRAFQGMAYLEYVDMGKNVTHMYKTENNHSIFYGCGNLETIVFPPKLTVENMIDNHGGGFDYFTSVTPTIIITGSLEEFLEIQKLIGKAGNTWQFTSATVENGKIVTAGYCETYYGAHSFGESPEVVLGSYFEQVKFAYTCERTECAQREFDEAKTIGAMFTYLGYSYTEVAVGGTYSMSQFYGINKENIEKYESAVGYKIGYGFVVSVLDNPIGNENATGNNVIMADGNTFKLDFADIKVSGITDENKDKGVVFCMYVTDGEEVYYLDGGKTSENVACKSYLDIVEIKK